MARLISPRACTVGLPLKFTPAIYGGVAWIYDTVIRKPTGLSGGFSRLSFSDGGYAEVNVIPAKADPTTFKQIIKTSLKKLEPLDTIDDNTIRTGNIRSAKGFWKTPEALYYFKGIF